jgi:hypothetical protein
MYFAQLVRVGLAGLRHPDRLTARRSDTRSDSRAGWERASTEPPIFPFSFCN